MIPGKDRSLPPILLGAHYDSVIDGRDATVRHADAERRIDLRLAAAAASLNIRLAPARNI